MNENQTKMPLVQSSASLRPTKKQKELLAFITQFIAENGYSPSYREIMNGLQYTSVATVAVHVNNLIARGHLRKRGHSARSLEPVDATGLPSTPLLTNEVKEVEEKWLVRQVENLFHEAESLALPAPAQVQDIATMLAALRILGLSGAAQSFQARLAALEAALRP